MKVAKVDSVKLSVKGNLILFRMGEHVCASHDFIHANNNRKVSLKEAMMTVREPLESGCNISKSDNSVKIS